MGYGDEIMATAQARQLYDNTGTKAYFNEYVKTWKENPCISESTKDAILLDNRTGSRPYVLTQTQDRVIFSPNYHAVPGEIHFTENEIEKATEKLQKLKNFIIVEPAVKRTFSKGNKDWGWDNWQKLVGLINQDYHVIQMVKDDSQPRLSGVRKITVDRFRS